MHSVEITVLESSYTYIGLKDQRTSTCRWRNSKTNSAVQNKKVNTSIMPKGLQRKIRRESRHYICK